MAKPRGASLGFAIFLISLGDFECASFIHTLTSQKLCVVLDCGFDLLGFDADVSLRGRSGTVL